MIEQQRGGVRYLQFSHFLHFPNLVHGIFTRHGGYSRAPFEALNTSTPVNGTGDSIDNVINNRQLVLDALDLRGAPCATLWQVHGADIAVVEDLATWRTDWAFHSYYTQTWLPSMIHKADALMTQARGVALALSFADCVPILLYDPQRDVIALAHGGWRGTARGIVMATIDAMRERFGCLPRDIYAGLGPSIGACCYEVSEQVRQLFLAQETFDTMPTRERYREPVRASAAFTTVQMADQPRLHLDLWQTNRNQLLMAGLLPEHIEVTTSCTSCHVQDFFSHRAEHGRTGRFPVVLALRTNEQ